MFMQLASSAESYHEHTVFDFLTKQINEHVRIQEYVITQKSNKQLKLKILMKVFLNLN